LTQVVRPCWDGGRKPSGACAGEEEGKPAGGRKLGRESSEGGGDARLIAVERKRHRGQLTGPEEHKEHRIR